MSTAGLDVRRARDARYMALALQLAARGRATASPNPMVGAVMVAGGRGGRANRIVGTGYHRKPGTPHAEVHVLRTAGGRARGATLYVNLEPCCHHNKRTPPCVPALIEAGVATVVLALRDPNPDVNGRGIAQLRRAGIQVIEGLMRREAERLNAVYIHRQRTGRPFVVLKAAMTLDGKIATANGESRWITQEPARRYVHRLRRQMDAVMVGLHTIHHDDPELTARLPGGARYAARQPLRVILDSRLQISPEARVLDVTVAKTLIATTAKASRRRIEQLRGQGVEVVVLPAEEGRVSLRACLGYLAKIGLSSVLLEGGGEVNAAALRSGVIDRLVLIVAPRLLGGRDTISVVGGRSPKRLREAWPVAGLHVRRLGDDLLIEGTPVTR